MVIDGSGTIRAHSLASPMTTVTSTLSRKQPLMFLTNHALVLIEIWREPDLTVKAISERVGITERATPRILRGLTDCALTRRGCKAAPASLRRSEPDCPFRAGSISSRDGFGSVPPPR